MLKKAGVSGKHLEILDKVEAPIVDDGSSSGFEESRKAYKARANEYACNSIGYQGDDYTVG